MLFYNKSSFFFTSRPCTILYPLETWVLRLTTFGVWHTRIYMFYRSCPLGRLSYVKTPTVLDPSPPLTPYCCFPMSRRKRHYLYRILTNTMTVCWDTYVLSSDRTGGIDPFHIILNTQCRVILKNFFQNLVPSSSCFLHEVLLLRQTLEVLLVLPWPPSL